MIDLEMLPNNLEIFDSFIKANSKLQGYNKIMCSISGGSDSDIILDIVSKLDDENKIEYVFFDTGLEYEATKQHLQYLENKYNIHIKVEKAIVPIPITCKKYGQPFISKQVSEYIQRLQRYEFKWEDLPFETLYKRYPKCKSALRWWCNDHGKDSRFNINYNKYLKEFMVRNPPTFAISNKCCTFAKKDVAKQYKKVNNTQLSITGIRKSEGGVRSNAYKNCFSADVNGCDEYRPIFWYKKETKRVYEDYFKITNSACYTEYGLKRTGCAGCPFGKDFENELKIIEKYEPKLFKAVNNIFGDSYEYTRQYREFVKNYDKFLRL